MSSDLELQKCEGFRTLGAGGGEDVIILIVVTIYELNKTKNGKLKFK